MIKGEKLTEKELPFVRSANNYNTAVVSDYTGLSCGDESLAVQDMAEECDINTIMRRFGQGQDLPNRDQEPNYPDFTEVTDFHTAMNAVRQAGEAFMTLPAQLRAEFNNDAGAFLEFIQDDKNREKAEKMGLVPPPKAATEPDPSVPSGDSKEGDTKKDGKVSPSTVTASKGTVQPDQGGGK